MFATVVTVSKYISPGMPIIEIPWDNHMPVPGMAAVRFARSRKAAMKPDAAY